MLAVRVTPRCAREEVRIAADMVQLRVTAPPSDGAANAAVIALVAAALGVAPSRVTLAQGAGSRIKRLHIG